MKIALVKVPQIMFKGRNYYKALRYVTFCPYVILVSLVKICK